MLRLWWARPAIIGTRGDRRAVGDRGAVVVAQRLPRQADVVVRFGEIRLEPQRAIELLQRFIEFLL